MNTRLPAAFIIVALAVSAAMGQPLTTAFTYQGQLKNGGGPAAGLHDLRFQLHNALTLGAPVGPVVCLDNVSVIDGLFNVSLDFGAEFAGLERFLEIEVRIDGGLDCTDLTDFTILAPRQALTAAPNALFASNAGLFDGLNSTAFLQSIPVPLTLSGVSDTHIIRGENTSSDSNVVGVYGSATGISTNHGVFGLSTSEFGRGVSGVATATNGITFGGRFASASTSGLAVYGFATAATGTTYGVYGETFSTSGRGVYGDSVASTGETYGVFGRSASGSESATGVYGVATAGTGITYGGRFDSNSTGGRAVSGYASAATGSTHGVLGQSNSTSGKGVSGYAYAGTGPTYGGRFESFSNSGTGVYGLAHPGGTGVYGKAIPDFTISYGVIGESNYGYAVLSSGNFASTGLKSFRIDHPDDPANKYLLHYAPESPEVINFYRGTVVLDGRGEAVVELPHYFAKINTTPSYMLTAVGAPMPMIHVAEEIDEAALSAGAKAEPGDAAPVCSFRIAGGKPKAKVSWRVEAVRNDRWVQQRGAPVEVLKEGQEKGTYQHPELYGQAAEKGMNYEAEQARPSQPTPLTTN